MGPCHYREQKRVDHVKLRRSEIFIAARCLKMFPNQRSAAHFADSDRSWALVFYKYFAPDGARPR